MSGPTWMRIIQGQIKTSRLDHIYTLNPAELVLYHDTNHRPQMIGIHLLEMTEKKCRIVYEKLKKYDPNRLRASAKAFLTLKTWT